MASFHFYNPLTLFRHNKSLQLLSLNKRNLQNTRDNSSHECKSTKATSRTWPFRDAKVRTRGGHNPTLLCRPRRPQRHWTMDFQKHEPTDSRAGENEPTAPLYRISGGHARSNVPNLYVTIQGGHSHPSILHDQIHKRASWDMCKVLNIIKLLAVTIPVFIAVYTVQFVILCLYYTLAVFKVVYTVQFVILHLYYTLAVFKVVYTVHFAIFHLYYTWTVFKAVYTVHFVILRLYYTFAVFKLVYTVHFVILQLYYTLAVSKEVYTVHFVILQMYYT